MNKKAFIERLKLAHSFDDKFKSCSDYLKTNELLNIIY